MSYLDSLFSLAGKVAVVTGASRGAGKAIAEALLKAGAEVLLVATREDLLREVVETFNEEGLRAAYRVCDLRDRDQLDGLINYVEMTYGRVDVLVNNAGVTFGHDLLDYPDEEWTRTYEVNLRAPFILSRAFGKIMKRQKSGSIINITSLNAELAFPDNPAYVTFKGGLRQLTKSLALDLGRYGVRANNVGPGYMKTSMTAKSWADPVMRKQREDRTVLGRWGEPEDLAGVLVFLSSDASSYVTGQDIYVDGGWLIKGL